MGHIQRRAPWPLCMKPLTYSPSQKYKQHTTSPKHLVTVGEWFLRMVTSLYNWNSGVWPCTCSVWHYWNWGGWWGTHMAVPHFAILVQILWIFHISSSWLHNPGCTRGTECSVCSCAGFISCVPECATHRWKPVWALYVCGGPPVVKLQPHPYPLPHRDNAIKPHGRNLL